ncbi:MAG: EXLDI protein, partial [Thermotogae bacterium]
MPRRNIYIKQKNLKVFERAAAHGNISQVIVEALKMYVKSQDL